MNNFLLEGVDEKTVNEIVKHLPDPVTVQKGEAIQNNDDAHCIGILLSGSAKCYAKNSEVIMRTFSSGDIFGVTNLFEQRDVSVIIATSICRVIFIERSRFQDFLNQDSTFAMNYIRFLTDRLCFLNRKISLYSLDNVERKVYMYIEDNVDSNGDIMIGNMSVLAKTLGVGRTSLYRSLENLCSKDIISKSGKKYHMEEFVR